MSWDFLRPASYKFDISTFASQFQCVNTVRFTSWYEWEGWRYRIKSNSAGSLPHSTPPVQVLPMRYGALKTHTWLPNWPCHCSDSPCCWSRKYRICDCKKTCYGNMKTCYIDNVVESILLHYFPAASTWIGYAKFDYECLALCKIMTREAF